MTITEIAEKAGVSIATVSRFLNNGPVKEETRKKLEKLVLEMNYVPSTFAKEIMNTSSKAVAVLTHSVSNFYTTEFIEAVHDRCAPEKIQCFAGYCVDAESEYRYLMDVTSRKINGVILHEPAEGQAQLELYNRISCRLPLVMIHSFPADADFNTVTVDQKKGMKKAMEYLLQNGHKRIAYVSGVSGYSFSLKEKIWRDTLKAAGIEVLEQDCIKIAGTNEEQGITATKEIMKEYFLKGNRPSAIFTANDLMAMGTLSAMREMNIEPGKDIGLMSHDNTILAQTLGVTCVDMKIKSVAIAAMDLLEYAIKETDKTPRHISIVPEIVVRNTILPVDQMTQF